MENCECNHGEDEKEKIKTPKDNTENLIKEIKDLGFKVEKTDNGEIKITE